MKTYSEMERWATIPSFMKIDIDVQAILKFYLRNLRSCNVGVIDGRDLCYMLFRWLHVVYYSYQVS
jgi:hypothetical protein